MSSYDEAELEEEEEEEEEEEYSSSYEEEETNGPRQTRMAAKLTPATYDFEHATTEELKRLLEDFQPRNIILDSRLYCFIPALTPTVGDVDPFVKIPRPDGEPDGLGLTALDEPNLIQSDPSVLALDLASSQCLVGADSSGVVSYATCQKDVTRWIEQISALRNKETDSTMTYQVAMPQVQSLIQVWEDKYEKILSDGLGDDGDKSNRLPTADLDVSLEDYAKISCLLCDVPVGKSKFQSFNNKLTLTHHRPYRIPAHVVHIIQHHCGKWADAVRCPCSEDETKPAVCTLFPLVSPCYGLYNWSDIDCCPDAVCPSPS